MSPGMVQFGHRQEPNRIPGKGYFLLYGCEVFSDESEHTTKGPFEVFPPKQRGNCKEYANFHLEKQKHHSQLKHRPSQCPPDSSRQGSHSTEPPAHSPDPQTSICWLWVTAAIPFTIQERDMLTEGPTITVRSSGKQHHAPGVTWF